MKINIGCSTDDNYAQHLGVMIYSILVNCSESENIVFYILDCGISKLNKDKIKRLCNNYKSKINFIKPKNKTLFNNLKIGKHLTVATYYKLLLPEIVKVKKLLYLDSDIIVEGDIKELWDFDLGKYTIGAVMDGDLSTSAICKKNLCISGDYFNSGVMLINCVKWRNEKILTKVVDYIKNNPDKIYIQEQDGLNYVLQGKWKKIPFEWNLIHTFFYHSKELEKLIGKKHLKKIISNPRIIHYTIKPWKFDKVHPLRHRYWYYLKKTPWKYYRYKDKNIKTFFLRIFKLMIRWIPWETKIKIKKIILHENT